MCNYHKLIVTSSSIISLISPPLIFYGTIPCWAVFIIWSRVVVICERRRIRFVQNRLSEMKMNNTTPKNIQTEINISGANQVGSIRRLWALICWRSREDKCLKRTRKYGCNATRNVQRLSSRGVIDFGRTTLRGAK